MYGYVIHTQKKDFEIIQGEVIETDEIIEQFEKYEDFITSLYSQNLSVNKCMLVMAYNNETECPIDEFIYTKNINEAIEFTTERSKMYGNINIQGFKSVIDGIEYIVDVLGDSGISY